VDNMMKRNLKKAYEPMKLSYVRFETENVLWTSGFFGEEDDFTKDKENTISVNAQTDSRLKDQINPT